MHLIGFQCKLYTSMILGNKIITLKLSRLVFVGDPPPRITSPPRYLIGLFPLGFGLGISSSGDRRLSSLPTEVEIIVSSSLSIFISWSSCSKFTWIDRIIDNLIDLDISRQIYLDRLNNPYGQTLDEMCKQLYPPTETATDK